MFTGIVEETGRITAVSVDADGRRLRIAAGFDEVTRGQSVSVSGVCLTVETRGDGWFEVFTATETLSKTVLDELEEGDAVNLERAVRAEDRLDGHIVQGHVDTTTTITDVEQTGEDSLYTFALPAGYEQYVVARGSITVDGVSLTVADVDESAGTFQVTIVPETAARTTFSDRGPGAEVHVEVDIVAKYVDSLLDADSRAG